ncbi:M20/M25/M40 family metallo-hydrolase [Anaerosphaera multitolerans]|uniref:M20/M25/M40 family metallo-hydrolase n=1 Tax=Anaerosphaera multitolerans TaxID=2487351 RepID=A0A437S5X4_9FIRM|nr:M20/M25/M40 family metallo-hydrolase [Anaerosphaera multitolerans]RVU54410.1 M20/M25/M40 family metallo-hydrolase [Anaerosphaera multitolerans]
MNKNRLVNTFMNLVRIDSESKNEGKFHEYLKNRCKEIGLQTYEDNTKKETGLGAGNLLCTLEANSDLPPLMFCCHTDTVQPGIGIKPFIDNEIIYSEGNTILAADDKAGIAAILEMITVLQETNINHGKIELLFTPGEEIGLLGISAFDMTKLESKYGYVLDSAGPVGGILMASPNLYFIEATFHGKAAHAGVEPELGASAIQMAAKSISKMKLGRVDQLTTSNIGTIKGGIATNVVPETAHLTAEIRSISEDQCYALLSEMKQIMYSAAREFNGSVEINTKKLSTGYQLKDSSYVVNLAGDAFNQLNIPIDQQISGGASDANVLNANGIETVNLAIGYEKIHTTEEFIPIAELEKITNVAIYLATNHYA